jgi:hypothetical protein
VDTILVQINFKVAGMLEESYPRFYKSAPLPEKPQENHITNVVGRNFEELVLDPHKDVMLMVYINRHVSHIAPRRRNSFSGIDDP